MGSEPQGNVDLVRRAFSAFNSDDIETCTRLMTDDFIINLAGMPYQMHGRDAWMRNVETIKSAFPNIQGRIEDIFSSGDRVAVRLTFHGTHEGEFQGIPATGRDVTYTSIELYRVTDGKLAEEWISADIATLMRQLTAPADA